MGASVTLTSHCILQWHLATKFSLTEALKSPPQCWHTNTHKQLWKTTAAKSHFSFLFLFLFFFFFWGRCFSFGKASRCTCNNYSETLLWFYRIRVSQPEAVSLLNHVGKAILAQNILWWLSTSDMKHFDRKDQTHACTKVLPFALIELFVVWC